MFSTFETMIAFRYLRAKRNEGIISVIAGFSLLGIALGVATLIVVMSVMNGFRQELLSRILGMNGHITVYDFSQGIENYEELTKKMLSIEGVNFSAPIINGQVMVTNKGYATGAL